MTTFAAALLLLLFLWTLVRLRHRQGDRDLGAMSPRWLADHRLSQAPDPQR